ncbi:hypothetical protein HanRHA438_Chr03g0127041 [Helianthus annuus]|nr:hypothetical protein HanIR_Chr03g0125971 [Helianthus annuus]KAJ0936104.1 hypothetical protein HanRHA438_Chr03g0127041 [Helianthus annuus]
MYLMVLVDRLAFPKMKLSVRKLDEFPSKAPIREHRTREIELRVDAAVKCPLRTLAANPLSVLRSCMNSTPPN